MKQFLYLDYDIVNSIIAQSEKGYISGITVETETGKEKTSRKGTTVELTGEGEGSILKLARAALKLDVQGSYGVDKGESSSSKELITKTLHDAAFDMAYEQIHPFSIPVGDQSSDDYGAYVEIKRVFDVVDFDYLQSIFSKGGVIEFIKKINKEKIETAAESTMAGLNRNQLRENSTQLKSRIKKAVEENNKQYDDVEEIIKAIRQLIPYNRMLISSDGYLIPLDERYFRIDPQNLGFKYGGEITCVGMITNIIGEDIGPVDSKNVFATLQYSVNEILRQVLPTDEKNLCIVHPIAVYYGDR